VEALLGSGVGPLEVRRIVRESSAESAARLRGRAG
jgi:hypothetical protein